jgi:hypothetical protein
MPLVNMRDDPFSTRVYDYTGVYQV